MADLPALVGRQAELATLGAALESARAGHGCVAVVEGEAGIGKSALVSVGLTRAGAGLRVFSAGADEMDGHRPFGVVADAFGMRKGEAGARGEIATLLDGVGPAAGDPQELSFRVAEAALILVEELDEPSLVIAEDLQWADPASLVVLHRLARRVRQEPCTLVFSARPLPRRPELQRLLSGLAAEAVFINLGPLGQQATAEMIRSLIGAEPSPDLLASAAKAGGNPLYLREMVGALADDQLIEISRDGSACAPQGVRPVGLTATILGRLSFLGAETKELLSLAAVLGTRFSVEHLKLLSGLSAVALGAPLREALTARVLSEDGDQLVFRHDLIREALYAAIPEGLRASLHREAAEAMDRAGSPARKRRDKPAWSRGCKSLTSKE